MIQRAALFLCALPLLACQHGPSTPPAAAEAPKSAFVARVNRELKPLLAQWEQAEWVKATYITHDTEQLAAHFHQRVMAYQSQAVREAARFDGQPLSPKTARAIARLKTAMSLPAPSDEAQRATLAALSASLGSAYGKGKFCEAGRCQTLGELSEIMATSRDYDALLRAWAGWRTIARPMRGDFERFVKLANAGAKELGFSDLGALWKSGYDMPPEAFEAEVERLWTQVKPLYEQLHCYVRRRLVKTYGAKRVDPKGAIPAHLLGNMWAQEWSQLYPLLAPYPKAASVDLSKALKAKGVTPKQMVKMAEGFFTSMGLKPLPDTFWERSMFTKPADREVVCHASAWDVNYNNDLRIKMCIKVDAEDFVTVHHELGHDYYYTYYYQLPILYQQGANDGFHEGIGDTIALSVTPDYLKKIGLLGPEFKADPKAELNLQLQEALDKVAFLPFGKLIDQWRWEVFSGKVAPADYNRRWWALREAYQGIKAPIARAPEDFDPGAKYHVPANVPYTRYFLARILQFQFQRALCEAAGYQGPLHRCSVYGSKAAGEKLSAMLAMGASEPWPDALEALTGQRQMDASALLEYFQPLSTWLAKQNAGQRCGW